MSAEIVSGVGTRYGVVFVLDENGLPFQETSSATPETGMNIEGIKTTTATDPEPQRFVHYGNDAPYAQDSLPPQAVETFTITTSKTNFDLDTYLEGALIRTYGSEFAARLADSDLRGNEPLVMAAFYRQALDTAQGSTTFGKLRQWNVRIYPAARISPITDSYEGGIVDKTYQGTPTLTGQTPWDEDYEVSTWGAIRGSHIEATMSHQPRINIFKTNGTITSWNLTHTPADSSNLKVWINGSLTVPGSITYGSTPAFTTAALTPGSQVFALIGTDLPNMNDN